MNLKKDKVSAGKMCFPEMKLWEGKPSTVAQVLLQLALLGLRPLARRDCHSFRNAS